MIQSVHKAVMLLDALAEAYPKAVSLQELAMQTGIGKSTCVHILNTLIEDDLAERLTYAQYSLSAGCFYLTRHGRFDRERLEICRPVLRWLKDKTGETVLIAQMHNAIKYTVDYVLGKYHLKDSGNILRDDIYRTATGRLLTAYLPQEELVKVIQRHGLPKAPHWQDFPDMQVFQRELNELKTMPWVRAGNPCPGGVAIGYAAPLYADDEFFGALGIAAFSEKGIETSSKREQELIRYLLCASQEINRRLKF